MKAAKNNLYRPLLLILLAVVTLIPASAGAAETPNVVMIMVDDMGWSEVAAYRRYQGLDDPFPTPNIDRLCAEGMMFTDAHSPAALCAPTRFSMLTGSNPPRNGREIGTWGFTASPNAFNAGGRKHITVGEIAQAAGYRTAFFGKMHLGGGDDNLEENMPAFPLTYGFDYHFNVPGGIQDPPYCYFENDRFVKIDPADPLNPSVPGYNSDLIWWLAGSYLGPNGTGKTTFLNHLAATLGLAISYKKQYIDISKFKNKDNLFILSN